MSITEAIIDAASELQDGDAEDLDFVLYDWINPDALGELMTSARNERCSVEVEFTLASFQVTINTDQTITVERTAPGSNPGNAEQEVILGE